MALVEGQEVPVAASFCYGHGFEHRTSCWGMTGAETPVPLSRLALTAVSAGLRAALGDDAMVRPDGAQAVVMRAMVVELRLWLRDLGESC